MKTLTSEMALSLRTIDYILEKEERCLPPTRSEFDCGGLFMGKKQPNPICPSCRRAMHDARGIGEKIPRWVCDHPDCTSHHQGQKCPTCSNPPIKVDVKGIGDIEYTCDQDHTWSKF